MKRLALILSFIFIAITLCSCINQPEEVGGTPLFGKKDKVGTDDSSTLSTDDESSSANTDNADPVNPGQPPEDPGPLGLGCAGTLDGRTVVISIFADDATAITLPWSQSAEDVELRQTMLRYLGIACRWISEQAYAYDIKSEFIYDWSLHADLTKTVGFDRYNMLVDDDTLYNLIARDISNNIGAEELLKKYDASNIVYLFFYNTTEENTLLPVTLSHVNSRTFDVEYSTIPTKTQDSVTTPSILAHEMLHFFGAYDLYAFEGNPIPAEYLEHHAVTDPMDIMSTVVVGEEIPSTLSVIDAYYIGLIDRCDDVDEFGLPIAERFLDK